MKALITTLSALALAGSLSYAEDKPPGPPPGGPGGHDRPKPEAVFAKLDTNTDGSISLEEFKAGPMGQHNPAKAEEAFGKMDKDKSGGLSLEEFNHRTRQLCGSGHT